MNSVLTPTTFLDPTTGNTCSAAAREKKNNPTVAKIDGGW